MIYQVSVILKDISVRLSWDTLADAIKAQLGVPDVFVEKLGNLQCRLYMPDAVESQQLQSQLRSILTTLSQKGQSGGGLAANSFIVMVKTLSPEDVKNLKPDVSDALNARPPFQEALALMAAAATLSGATVTPPASSAVTPPAAADVTPPAASDADVTPPAAAAAPALPEDGLLGELTGQLRTVSDKLLSKVRGQNHAVRELIEGVFESLLFSKNDPAHRGPLASFLFMGPSGVGKTFLATQFGELSGRPVLTLDMSEYANGIGTTKLSATVTNFVSQHPNAIVICDEIEKASLSVIYLFLQILDAGRLTPPADLNNLQRVQEPVSCRDVIIIMTSNAGASLYDNAGNRNLSNIPRSALIDALLTESLPGTGGQVPVFPPSIVTRMANGHIIMFNHLEPYALMEIVQDEIDLQLSLFTKATGVAVEYDKSQIPPLVMYAGAASADARSLRSLARSIVIRELQDAALHMDAPSAQRMTVLKRIYLTLGDQDTSGDAHGLFHQSRDTQALVFSADAGVLEGRFGPNVQAHFTDDGTKMRKLVRGVVDFILLDPYCGFNGNGRLPSDVEDIPSAGMDMFSYLMEFYPEIPLYLLDTGRHGPTDFTTLLAQGAREVLSLTDGGPLDQKLERLSLNALLGNNVYQLSRGGKYLSYNAAQYVVDENTMEVCFSRLSVHTAYNGADMAMVSRPGENSAITFDDVVGCESAKKSLQEFCRILEDPRKCMLEGKRIPKGILLYGPPGTGKTMLAKAMANEAKATFLPTTATAFFNKYVGQTEENIRQLFKKARQYAPSVIFIDEVDAIARQRTGEFTSIHNEDALNALLAEMDGFVVDEKRPVFIIAATNYDVSGSGGKTLDGAFVRRFDRKILVPLPDKAARYELFRRTLKRHNIDFGSEHESVLQNIAARSSGLCNADINMIVEMYARDLGDKEPSPASLLDALDKYRFGDENNLDEAHLHQVAFHEAGHALVSWVSGFKPLFVTIVSRANFGGYMETASEGKGTYTFNELKDIICRALAGRAAEIEFFGEDAGINTGATSDLEQARSCVRACLKDYGMGQSLFLPKLSEAGEALMQEQFSRARSIIAKNRAAMEGLAEMLLREKCLDQDTVDRFLASTVIKD